MKKLYKLVLLLLFITTVAASNLQAQNLFFTDINESAIQPGNGQRVIIPQKFRSLNLNNQGLKSFLWSLPSEKNVSNRNTAPILELPMPDGSMAKFHVWESSVQEPALAAKFPEIRTFAGQGIDDPYATIRFDYNPYFGFSAQILSSQTGRIFIDPYKRGNVNYYMSYFSRDFKKQGEVFKCDATGVEPQRENVIQAAPCRGMELRTYRLAFTCTGEFAQAVGGGLAGPTHAAIVLGVNRLTQVYEDELAIRLVLVGNNDLVEFLNPATDPFLNDGGSDLNIITGAINTAIGSGSYDIGHLGCTASDAGVAGLSVVCGSSKGRGLTGGLNPVGDPYYIDYVAHEMGHQFGAPHTFNSANCASPGGSYEPGGGTTIMAYAGICAAAENIQPNSDPIFHAKSFDDIINFITSAGGSTCGVVTTTGNTLPVITAMNNNNISIPINTPFTLTATATDADGDALTYNWEGWDFGTAGTWPSAANSTTRPLFRTRVSKTTGSRTFPDMRVIAANYPLTAAPSQMDGLRGEVLPAVARAMKFRLTVRDNRAGGGGVVSGGEGCQAGFTSTFQVNAVGTTPFTVTIPNGGESYSGGTAQTITWNTAGSENAPISTANVKISLSTDGGLTYPTVITASTTNDGTESVTIPNVLTTTARIKIEAVGNIFFDISNANFTIAAPAVGFGFSSPAAATIACNAATTASTTLGTVSNGGYVVPINLSATAGVPAGTNVTFSVNPLIPGNSTVVTLNNTNTLSAGTYNVTVTGVSGTITQSQVVSFIIQAGAGPSISTQPLSQILCAGSNVTFTVTASAALSYQWQVSTDGGVNFSNIGGATTTSYAITGVTATQNNYQYRVIVTGQCNVTTSAAATLTVNTPPSIGTQPAASTICAAQNTTFTVGATGNGLSYQWQVNTGGCAGPTWTNIANGAPYSGATTATLTITGATTALNSYGYRAVVTGSCAPTTATSNCVALVVNTPVSITTQPSASVICAGANTTFTLVAAGTTPTYQWQESTNAGATWINVTNGGIYSGATTASLTLTGVTAGMNNYLYRSVVSGATSCAALNSANAALTVNTAPAISAQPAAATTLCVGSNTSYTVTAGGTALTYQWQVSTAGAGGPFTNITNGGGYSGATTATLTLTGITAAMNTYVYRAVINGTCAPAATSANAALTVISPVAITAQPAATTQICSTGNTSFSVTGTSTVGIIYQWQVSTDNGTTWNNVANAAPYSGATTATLTITNVPTNLSGYRYRALLSNATCTVPTISTPSALTVNVLPTATIATPDSSIQAGETAIITATTTPATGLNIAWYRNGVLIPGATTNTYTVNVNTLGAYRVVVTDQATGTCINQSNLVTITASPSDRLFIFPSPNDGQFKVTYYNDGSSIFKQGISIYDRYGRQVYDKVFDVTQSYQLHDIDLRRYSAGIYYVVLRDSKGKRLKTGEVMIR